MGNVTATGTHTTEATLATNSFQNSINYHLGAAIPDTALDATIFAVRAWELTVLVLVLFGCWLVYKFGRTWFVVALYTGTAVAATVWDLILQGDWFFRITLDPRFIPFFTIDGRTQALWAPFSYSFYFGIPLVLALHHRKWLDEHLGPWQYVAISLPLGLLDIVIEGITVGGLHLYLYRIHTSWLISGVPITNILLCGLAEAFMLYTSRTILRLLDTQRPHTSAADDLVARSADLAPAGAATVTAAGRQPGRQPVTTPSSAAAAVDTREHYATTGMFLLGLLIPGGSLCVAVAITAAILNAFKPW